MVLCRPPVFPLTDMLRAISRRAGCFSLIDWASGATDMLISITFFLTGGLDAVARCLQVSQQEML